MTTRWTNQWFRHTTIFFLCVTVLLKFLAEYQATTFFFPAVGTKAKKMVVVISWNVHCVPVAGGCSENHVRTVAKYAARLAKQHDAQVLVLNEIFLPRVRAQILKALRNTAKDYTWNMTPIANSAGTAPLVGSGVVIAWRGDLKKDGSMHEIAYKTCCQFDCLSYKGGLQLPLRHPDGGRFHVLGTHMQAWEIPLVCDGVRDQQSNALGSMASQLEGAGHILPGEPVLFAGDFNEKHSAAMEARLGAKHVTCESGCATHSHGEFDHFYLRGGGVTRAQGMSFRAVRAAGASNPSDHLPILTNLDLSK